MISMKFDSHKKRLFGAKVSYREHALAYHNHSFMTCGGPEAFTSTTFCKKCGGKTSSGGQEPSASKHIRSSTTQMWRKNKLGRAGILSLKTHQKLPYPIVEEKQAREGRNPHPQNTSEAPLPKCGGKTSSGGQEPSSSKHIRSSPTQMWRKNKLGMAVTLILKTHQKLPYPNVEKKQAREGRNPHPQNTSEAPLPKCGGKTSSGGQEPSSSKHIRSSPSQMWRKNKLGRAGTLILKTH